MDSPETWGALYYRRINNMAKSGNSGSNSGSNSGNNGGNTGATNSAGMSIGFGGGLSGFSNSDQGGAGGWTGNSFGGGVNATGGGTSIGSSTGSSGSTGSSSSNPSTESGQTFGEAITSGGSITNGGQPQSYQEAMALAQQENAAKAREAKVDPREQFQQAYENTKKGVQADRGGVESDNTVSAILGLANPAYLGSAVLSNLAGKAKESKETVVSSYEQPTATPYTADTSTKIGNLGSKTAPSSSPAAAPSGDIGSLSFTGLLDSFASPAQANDSIEGQPSSGSNNGMTYRGGTVSDGGTGGSISSGLTPPSRDESSIGLGVYDPDKANYDQDNWNRGMEAQSSSLVSDEECKAFAKRAFSESSEPFKKVRVTIVKKI